MLVIDNLTKKIDDKIIFDSTSLSVASGKMIAIMGKSGSGKSTLLNILSLLEQASYTKYILNNKRVTSQQQHLAHNIGYLFQNFALVDNQNVAYNLKIAKSKITNDEMSKVLLKVGLSDSYLDRKVYTLSGGEQQRVAIARLLIKPCQLILADEPTAALDEENRNSILNLLRQFTEQNKIVIIATHDDVVAKQCDEIYIIKHQQLHLLVE